MFGHQDDQPTEQNDQAATTTDATAGPVDQGHLDQQSIGSDPEPDTTSDIPTPKLPPAQSEPWQHPGKPLDDAKDQAEAVISPAGGYPKALSSKETPIGRPHLGAGSDDNQLTEATDEGLIEVKQKALDELFPLIDKLDQTSEEHFKTLMMIIQASDNHTLIEKAYQIAQTIDDEKARAQALLDIVNEINYFTQQPEI